MTETAKNKKLTRTDIVNAVSDRNEAFFKAHVRLIVNETLDALADAIASGNQVEIRRLGVFSTRRLGSRKSRNPRTGEAIVASPYTGVKFRVSQEIKRRLSGAGD
jgi:nucleoid DNA-binding protein